MSKFAPHSESKSLAAHVMQSADQRFVATAGALLRAAFLFSSRPDAPHRVYGLSLAEADVLSALGRAREPSLNCSEIAEGTLITKGGITRVLDRLEARGLLKRVPSRDDRRSVSIQLSAKGLEFCRNFFPEVTYGARETLEEALGPKQVKSSSSYSLSLFEA